MERVIEYCSFHLAPGHSVKERKNFNKQFMRMNTARLCELASASHYLDLKSLIDLTCRALAKHIQGKNPEEIRETFNLPDDLTEEEKVAPIEFGMEDSRVRMLNSLYARKRKELAEAKRLDCSAEQLENRVEDDHRDVDDLLSFIEGGGGKNDGSPKASGGQGSEASPAKSSGGSERKRKKKERERLKKKERAEQQAKLEAEKIAAEKAQLEADRAAAARRKLLKQEKQQGGQGQGGSAGSGSNGGSKKRPAANQASAGASSTSERGKSGASGTDEAASDPPSTWSSSGADSRLSVDLDSDDISDEDELDPDLRAAQDREVEEFARRLNGSLNDLAGQQSSGHGSASHADMFAAFVTNMQPTSATQPPPLSAPRLASEAAVAPQDVTPEPEPAPERLFAETKRVQTLAAEVTRSDAATQQRWTDATGPIATAEQARAARAATSADNAGVPASQPQAPPPHDFRQKLAGSIQRSLHDTGAVHSWVPPRRVVTAVWAPPPLFEASDAIPGVTKGCRAVSYCTATLTVPGVKSTDVCSASFTGLGQAHVQLSAHVSDIDEVTVILRGIDVDASQLAAETGDAGGSGPPQKRRKQPSAGQLTVVIVDYLEIECAGGSVQTSITDKGVDADTREGRELVASKPDAQDEAIKTAEPDKS